MVPIQGPLPYPHPFNPALHPAIAPVSAPARQPKSPILRKRLVENTLVDLLRNIFDGFILNGGERLGCRKVKEVGEVLLPAFVRLIAEVLVFDGHYDGKAVEFSESGRFVRKTGIWTWKVKVTGGQNYSGMGNK